MKFQHLLGLVVALSFAAPVSAQELRPELPETTGETKIVDEEQKAIDMVTDKVLDPSAPAASAAPTTSAPVGKPTKAPPAPKVEAQAPVEQAPSAGKAAVLGDSVGAVGHGAVKGVGTVGRGAVNGAEAVGHGAQAVGQKAVTGAEAVGHGAVKSVEAVGHGAEAVGRKAVTGAQAVGGKAVTGIEKIGHGSAELAETVGEKTKAGAVKVGHGAKKGAETIGHGAENLGRGALTGVENLGRGVKRGFEAIGHSGSKLIDHGKSAPSTSSIEQTQSVAESVKPSVEAPAAAPKPGAPASGLDLEAGSNGREPQADAPAGW